MASTFGIAPRPRGPRVALGVLHIVVAVTAVLGGGALVLGSLSPGSMGMLVPDLSYLEGSPFPDFVAPGVVLAIVVGGTQLAAGILALRSAGGWRVASAIASFGLAIWIFVQMTIIPFSVLQALYFAAALGGFGLLLLDLGILRRRPTLTVGRTP